MHQYAIIIYLSDDDQAFISEVPERPGRNKPSGSTQAAETAIMTHIRSSTGSEMDRKDAACWRR